MSFLGVGGEAIVRLVHVGAVILWVGMLHFGAFVRPRILAGLSEGTMREVAPHFAARLLPWAAWTPIVVLASGALLYAHVWVRDGPAMMGWAIHAGSLVGLVMVGLVHAVSVPGLKRAAALLAGAPPPPPGLFVRLAVVGGVLVVLSWVALLLMVFGSHWPLFR